MHRLIAEGSVTAAHDVSDGGVAAAVAEMAVGGRLGVEATVPAPGESLVVALTNEAPGRLLLEAPRDRRDHLAARLSSLGRRIGAVTAEPSIRIDVTGPAAGREPVTIDLDAAVRAFTGRGSAPDGRP